MSSENPICHSPSFLLLPSHAAHYLVLWMRWEINKPLWKPPTQLRKLDTHSYFLTFPLERNHEQKGPLGTELCCPGRDTIWGKRRCASYLLPHVQTHLYFLQLCTRHLSQKTWTSTTALTSVMVVLDNVSLGLPDCGQERSELIYSSLLGP